MLGNYWAESQKSLETALSNGVLCPYPVAELVLMDPVQT